MLVRIACFIVTAWGLIGCETAELAKKDVEGKAAEVKDGLVAKVRDVERTADALLAQAKEDYVERAQREIEALTAKIEALEARVASASADLKKKLNAQIKDLDLRRGELMKKLVDLKTHRELVGRQLDELKSSVGQIDARLVQLRAQAQEMKGETRARLEAQVAELTAQRDATTKKLSEAKDKAERAVGELERGLDDALGQLRSAYDAAAKQLN